jgi:hypothetical protein
VRRIEHSSSIKWQPWEAGEKMKNNTQNVDTLVEQRGVQRGVGSVGSVIASIARQSLAISISSLVIPAFAGMTIRRGKTVIIGKEKNPKSAPKCIYTCGTARCPIKSLHLMP